MIPKPYSLTVAPLQHGYVLLDAWGYVLLSTHCTWAHAEI